MPDTSPSAPAPRARTGPPNVIGYWLAAALLVMAAQGVVPVLGPLIAAGGLLVGAMGGATRWRRPLAEAAAPPVPPAPADPADLSHLRHDLRGIYVPAMLSAERLQSHADPAVQRAAGVIMDSLDRATARIAKKPAAPSDP